MKSSADHQVKGKFHGGKGKTKKVLVKLMKDPTLEGKDENTIGRIQSKNHPEQRSRKMTVPAVRT